eukprot:12641356-Alexandrium_andersonii.AAC.1
MLCFWGRGPGGVQWGDGPAGGELGANCSEARSSVGIGSQRALLCSAGGGRPLQLQGLLIEKVSVRCQLPV